MTKNKNQIARKKAQNAKELLMKTNPEKLKIQQDKENATLERRNKLYEDEKQIVRLKNEEKLLLEETEKQNQKLQQIEIRKRNIITMWENVRSSEIENGTNFRIGSVLNEHHLISTLFQELEVVTIYMMTILWLIFKGTAYIDSSFNTNFNDDNKVLDQYKDNVNYVVIFEGSSSAEFEKYSLKGKVVYGKRFGETVNFSDTIIHHLYLPGIVMKKLIKIGFVTPVFHL